MAYLLDRCTEGAVRAVFDRLEEQLGTYDFLRIFNVILTVRGSEFGDSLSREIGINGIQRSNIYYCDPMCSGQKKLPNFSLFLRCRGFYFYKLNLLFQFTHRSCINL